MAKIRTHYDNLRVARNAPDSVIKAAYKALCQTYHPDKFQGSNAEAERIMKIINASYSVLIDPVKRAEHDALVREKEAVANQQHEKATFGETGEATEQTYKKKETKREYTPPPTEPESPTPKTEAPSHSTSANKFKNLASGQGLILLSMIVLICSAMVSLGILPLIKLGDVLALATIPLLLFGTTRLTSGLGFSTGVRWLVFILMLIPVINMPLLLFLNSRATKALRDAGYKLGILAAIHAAIHAVFDASIEEEPNPRPQEFTPPPTKSEPSKGYKSSYVLSLVGWLILLIFVFYSVIAKDGKHTTPSQQPRQQLQAVQNVPQVTPQDTFQSALNLFNQKRYEEALPLFKVLAEQGDARAQYALGGFYSFGHGVAQNYHQAVYWFNKAAEQGNANAQNALGNLNGQAKNYHQAVYWYNKAAEQGNADAQNALGFMYEFGYDVTQDYKQAVYWYNKAAEQGNADAIASLKKLSQ